MEQEKKRFLHSLVFPLVFTAILWLVKITETILDLELTTLGIYPLRAKGLIGILTAPLVHGDYIHLFDNTVPLLVLSIAIFYFYREIAFKVFFLGYIITGIWVWFGARGAYHIGASGLVYAFASFIFFSGVIRRNIRLASISLIVIFLYGSMVWGIFPIVERMSWESHLYGGVAGLVLAIYYKDYGPKRERYDWEFEDEEDDDIDETEEGYVEDRFYHRTSTSDFLNEDDNKN
jgi:membrane associated rhomboid family serine protease